MIIAPTPIKFMARQRKSFLLMLFIAVSFVGAAQKSALDGKLTDEKNAPLPLANVTLLKAADNTFAAASLTDSMGRFRVEVPAPGSYYIKFTSIGFVEHKTEIFTVPDQNFTKDFGTVMLKIDAKTMQNVTVEGLRPTITQLADRMVVAVEGTAMAAGNSAYSVLAKSPGVFVDNDGNVQLNGRQVQVQVDGRPTYLSPQDLKTMLEGMSAENLKNIEIITNPSARHEAEGAAGIININLKKNLQQGINGSIYASYNYNFKHQHGYSIGGNINHKAGKWNSFLNVDNARRVGGRDATFTRIFRSGSNTTYFDQNAIGNFVVVGPPSVRTGTDYTINSKHTVGAMMNFTRNTGDQEFLTETYIGSQPGNYSQFVDADNFSSNTFTNLTTNLHYTGKLDTLGKMLTADLDYVNIRNRGESFYNNYYTDLSTSDKVSDLLYTNTPNGYDIYSVRLDYTKPFSNNRKLEVGSRVSQISTEMNYKFYFNNGGLAVDPKRTNHFLYDENIYAAYFNWAGPISKKFKYQLGLRMEHTESLGNSITLKQQNDTSYANLFPSLFIQQTVSSNYGINYNLSRRLNRPNYSSLNPFRAYRDPYTWYQGNTGLRPSYTNAFTMIHTIHKKYNFTFTFQHQKDAMGEIPILVVEDTTTIYTTGNINDAWNGSFTAVAPLKIARKWDSQNTLVLIYNDQQLNSANGNISNKRANIYFQSNHTVLLPKDFRMEMTFMYRGRAVNGLYTMEPVHRFDLAFKKPLFKKKVDLTINANDIFKGMRYQWSTDINGNVNDFDQYFRMNTLSLNLRYKFQKGQKVEDKRRSGTVEEVNRL